MRLPLRHPPPDAKPAELRCAHLEALIEAARGVPLGPAARTLAAAQGRGRHGNALQWHLGLEAHDSSATLDWEDRIEIKMVSVWGASEGGLRCDKLKVCEAGVDPWHKLANVLWVFVDRVTRVVLGHRLTHRPRDLDAALRTSWGADPHFDQPSLFIEARDASDGSSAPAYYLSADCLRRTVLPSGLRAIRFDAGAWSKLRRTHRGRSPLLSLASAGMSSPIACPRCGGPLEFDAGALEPGAMLVARHGLPSTGPCALRGHVVIEPSPLPHPALLGLDALAAGIEGREDEDALWRLSDHVIEPEDHLH